MKECYVAKNISLKVTNFSTVYNFAQGKRLTFSKAINHIIEQWDKISVTFLRQQEATEQIEKMKKAEVVKYQDTAKQSKKK